MAARETVFEGKSLDDAVRKGLDSLGLARAEVMITMVEEGSAGFLGFGARPYKVRIQPRPGGAIPEPDIESGGPSRRRSSSRGRDRDRGRGGRGGRERSRGGARAERSERGERAERPERSERGERAERGERGQRSERGARGERSGRPARAGRGERNGSGDASPSRGGRPARERQSDPTPEPALADRAEAGDDGGSEPRRRRRGRRGGRGRRGERRGPAVETGSTPMPVTSDGVATAETAEPVMRAERTNPESVMQSDRYEPAEDRDLDARDERTRNDEQPVDDERSSRRRGRRGRGERNERGRPDESPSTPGLPPEELAALGKRWTEDLLKAMGFEGKVEARAEGDRVDVTLEVGEDDDLLTGHKGEVRQALQHLLNRMVNRGEGSRYYLQLEVNDFWKQREDELVGIAKQLAEQALATNGESVTEYLNSQERRIIHMTLRDDARVKTYALGTGMIKRLAVAPADHPERDTSHED